MQADTTTLAPCPFCGAQAHFEVDDDDRWEWVECESCGMQGNRSASLMESCKPKLAEAWNRRAPAPASGEAVSPFGYFRAEPFGWTDCAESDEGAKPLYEAPPAQEALLNPDMPTQELRLHMGELTTDEVLVARAAIRWANSQQEARVPLTSEQQRCIAEAHNVAACEEYFNARPQIDYIANRRIFEAGFSKGYGITAAQKEPK